MSRDKSNNLMTQVEGSTNELDILNGSYSFIKHQQKSLYHGFHNRSKIYAILCLRRGNCAPTHRELQQFFRPICDEIKAGDTILCLG